jgi:hypothetical protein
LLRPKAERTYKSSPERTTQIVTKGRSEPSGRRDAISSSSALPILSSSSAFQAETMHAPFPVSRPTARRSPSIATRCGAGPSGAARIGR